MKKILLAIALNLIIYSCIAAPYVNPKLKPMQHGNFMLYSDKNNTLAITRDKPINAKISTELVNNIAGNYYKDYIKLQTAAQKALFAYQYMVKIASQVDFIVKIHTNYYDERSVQIYLNSGNTTHGLVYALIPAQDSTAVYPLLLKLIKTRTSINLPLTYDNNKNPILNFTKHPKITQTTSQAQQIANAYQYPYLQPSIEQKALRVYLYLLELAKKTNFSIQLDEQYAQSAAVALKIPTKGKFKNIEIELIPIHEVQEVYPLLVDFAADRLTSKPWTSTSPKSNR